VRILSPVIEPTTALLVGDITDYFHCRTVGAKPVSHDRTWPAIAFHHPLEKLQCSLAIPALRRKDLQYLAFVIYRTPQIMRLSIDPDKHLVQVPTLVRNRSSLNTTFSNLRGKHRTETVPPEPHCLVTDVEAPLEENILDLPQRQRIADIHHHREADHLGRAVEITEWIAHRRTLRILVRSLKPIYSDNAGRADQPPRCVQRQFGRL